MHPPWMPWKWYTESGERFTLATVNGCGGIVVANVKQTIPRKATTAPTAVQRWMVMGMFEGLVLILLGFIAGFLVAWYIIRAESKDEIKKIEPTLVIREEKNIMTANAEFSIPESDMLYNISSKWIEGELSHKLAEEIWKYAMVNMIVDKRNMLRTYRAKLKVVDMGQLNPFCSYDERRVDNG